MALHSTALIHQAQPNNKTCVCTSLAMVLGVPAEQVIAAHHEAYFVERISTAELLRRVGLPFESFDSTEDVSPTKPGYYFLGVPSLNFEGGMHQIVANAFFNEEQVLVWEIYDPQMGTGAKWYTAVADESDPLQVAIGNGYVLVARVSHGWRDEVQEHNFAALT